MFKCAFSPIKYKYKVISYVISKQMNLKNNIRIDLFDFFDYPSICQNFHYGLFGIIIDPLYLNPKLKSRNFEDFN